ncbi:MAG: ABC transporter ATP-binding protein [Clostridia bacterium]|nr:ABC transporter ATP-binding protein [Clostridia bacterium]
MAKKNRYDQDEELDEKLSGSSFKKLLGYIKPHKKTVITTIILMLIILSIELLPPYFTSVVIDDCLPNKDYKSLLIIVALLTASMFVMRALHRIRSRITNEMAMEIIGSMRSDLFRHMQYLPLSFFDSRPHGKILVRVVNYFNAITNLFANGIFDLIINIFKMFIIVGIMFAMDIKFTLICLAVLPLFAVVLIIIRSQHQKAWRKYSSKQSNLNAYLQESINGMKITQSFAREKVNAGIFDGLCAENKKYWMHAFYIQRAIPLFVNVLSVATVLVIYVIGVGRISAGTMTIGFLIAFVAYVN